MTELIDNEFSAEFSPLESIRSRTKFALISLSLVLLLSLINAFVQYNFLQQFKDGSVNILKYQQILNQHEPVKLISTLTSIAGIFAIVSICMWFFSANKNLHKAGLSMVEFTPGWAVGWFFIPIAFLYYPFAVMTEIYKGTNALSKPKSDNWKSEASDITILFWWLLYWIPTIFILTKFSFSLDPYLMMENTIEIGQLAIYTVPVTVISGILLLRLIYTIGAKQEALAAH